MVGRQILKLKDVIYKIVINHIFKLVLFAHVRETLEVNCEQMIRSSILTGRNIY
jgi:hypothetical protein